MKFMYIEIILTCTVSICISSVVKRQATVIGNCRTPDAIQSMGRCLPINSCPPILDLINDAEIINDATAKYLRQYICSNSKYGDVWVCCPFRRIKIPQMSSRIVEEPSVDHSKHPNTNLLPEQCGVLNGDQKIIDGDAASLYEFPWAAALQFQEGDNIEFMCGGSLINNRYILTAAHCLRYPNRNLVGVRLGDINFKINPDCQMYGDQARFCAPEYQHFNVSSVDAVVHPSYDPTSLRDDIALIRLKEEANTTQYAVEPICLPITIAEKDNNARSYTIIGWGATANTTRSHILQKAEVPAQSNSVCLHLNPNNRGFSSDQVCVGGKRQAACYGDSGGPLMAEYVNKGKIRYLQYGLLSFGPRPCNLEDFPSTYTKIASYMGWILDALKP